MLACDWLEDRLVSAPTECEDEAVEHDVNVVQLARYLENVKSKLCCALIDFLLGP